VRRFGIVIIVFIMLAGTVTACRAAIYDVTDPPYNAAGDGITLDSPAINAAIDAADANGGGTVYFPAGAYKSGSIIMKDNITLELSANAVLIATDTADYNSVDPNPWDAYQDWGHSHWKSSLIWGIGVDNVAITGTGLINGDAMTAGDPSSGYGDRVISFKNCNSILIEDINIYRGGHFCIITSGCNDITIDNVLMDTNRDGINIDCCNDVNIVNCTVNSPKDDAICMKSSYCLGYKRPTENVTISNCTVMGHAVGYLLSPPGSDEGWRAGRIKFGTESNGGFKNITITDCNFEYCRGFMLATVDGGDIENIIIDNIQMTDLWCAPIFMRLGNRARGPGPPPPGTYRNVNISNITGSFNTTFDGNISCIASGIPGHCIEDVNFSNISVVYPGGGPAAWADIVLPENEAGHPDVFMFGLVTPSYGFYVRHAKGIEFHNSQFDFATDDVRTAFVLIDVNGFELDNVDAERSASNESHIRFDDVDNLNIHDCPDFPPTTASYDDMWSSKYIITAGEPFTVSISATAGSTGVSTTEMLMDSNYLDTEYSWLNAGTPKDVEFSDIQLYSLGEHRLEIDVCDINIVICSVVDFDLNGKIDFNDYAIFAADWRKESEIILQEDTVAWWKFDEGSGSMADDNSVNDNNGTLHNMYSNDWVTGYDGNALDFDGSNDYISVNDSNSISVGGGDFTISAWIYPHSIGGWRAIVTKIKNREDKEYAFSLVGNAGNGGLGLDIENNANNGIEYTAPIVTAYQWQHVMVVFDSTTLNAAFYHDFEPVPVVSGTINALPRFFDDDLSIGRWGGIYNTNYFDGIIDDVRICNYKAGREVRKTDLYLDYIIDFKDLDIFTDSWIKAK